MLPTIKKKSVLIVMILFCFYFTGLLNRMIKINIKSLETKASLDLHVNRIFQVPRHSLLSLLNVEPSANSCDMTALYIAEIRNKFGPIYSCKRCYNTYYKYYMIIEEIKLLH